MLSDEWSAFARRLGPIATALFVAYAAAVLAAILPVRLMEPQWQLRFGAALVDNGSVALLGLVLLHLGALLDPEDPFLRARRDRLARWAIAAVVGFLLLIPLQAVATWQTIHAARATQGRQVEVARRRVADLKQAITSASSPQDLQTRLQSLQGPTIGPAELAQPLPQLKQELLLILQRTASSIPGRIPGPEAADIWGLAQRSLQVGITALAFAGAFAAGAQRRHADRSLLEEWMLGRFLRRQRAMEEKRLRAQEGRNPALHPGAGARALDDEYFERLSREEENP
jgi:hypothetical protein